MAFPVDILTNVDHESLEQAAEDYMSQLSYRKTEYFILPNSKQIKIGVCNVCFVPLYGTDSNKKILALFLPDDSTTVVGLYLLGKWWGVEEVLKTAEPSKTGLIKVSTLGERIVLYVLNRIVLRNEKSSEEVFFLCHGEHESAKILWKDGAAIGFYSFKPKGSLCRNFVTQCYQLPVMDTVFVRKCHRGKDHGVKILEDFVCSFRNEDTGLKFPLSEAMFKVCEKYLRINPADKEFLWEVENTGGIFQRILIVKRLQGLKQKEKDHVVSKLIFEEEDATAPMEIEITKIQETTESTMEIVEETITDIMKEADDIPVTRCSSSSSLKRRGIRENSEERLSKNIIRVEDIEAGVESPIEVATEGSLHNTFSVKDSETVLRSTTDTVTATVTRISEFRGSQKEMGKYIITSTSDGTPVTHHTTSEEIKSKKSSKEEFEMVKEHTVEMQGTIIGGNDQSQIQSLVNVEIVKMSTGTEEEQHENLENIKNIEEDTSLSEKGKGGIKQMLDELEGGNAQSETDEIFSRTEILEEITEQPETHAKLSEKDQVYWDVEITEKKEREGSEVMEVHGKYLIEENRNDNLGPEKCEAVQKDTVLQQSVEIKDQTEMEVLCTEEVLSEQQKQCEAEKEVSEPHQRKTYKGTAFEKVKKNKVDPDDTKQVFSQSKLTQKKTSPETPSRRSKRLRHEPAETVRTTKSVKTTQQRTKHHSKAVNQEEHVEQPVDKSEHNSSEVIEESSAEHQAVAENEVKECKENELTVETVSTMDNEIRQVEKTLYVVPAVSELVEKAEKSYEKPPQQSSAEPVEVQESKTTFKELEERVEQSIETLSKTKVVIVELHDVSSKKAGDDHGEIHIVEQDNLKDSVSIEQQKAEDTLEVEKQDGTLNMDTKPMEELACTTEEYIVATDVSVTQEQENKSELKSTDLIVQGKDEKTETEQSKKHQQDSYEEDKQYPKQGEQAKKKGLTDITSRSTRPRDQPVDPGVTPVRRSTRGQKVILHKLSGPKTLTKKRIAMDENVRQEESDMTNTNVDEATTASPGYSELLIATETDDKVEVPQITEAIQEKIPAVEAENDNATEKAIKEMTNKEINLAGETDIKMSSLVQEQNIHAPVSTEISLRHRTIKVTSTPSRKSGRVQKQDSEVVVEHQFSLTEERHEVMDQYVSKMENTGASLAELEPVKKTEIGRDKYEIISATEEVVNVCMQVNTTKTCLEEMPNTNIEETVAVEMNNSEILIVVDIDDKEEKMQILGGPEEEVSLVEADHDEAEKDKGTPKIRLQKSTVVLVDLNQVSQDRDDECLDVLRHSQTEEQLKVDKTGKNEKVLEEAEQQEQQKNKDSENILEEDKMEAMIVKTYQLHKLNEKQMPTEDQSTDKKISNFSLEENLDEAPVTTERSLRRRTIQVHSPPKRKYRHIQKQEAETLGHSTEKVLITEKRVDEWDQACVKIDDEDKASHKSNVKATDKGIPVEDVAEKERETVFQVEEELSQVKCIKPNQSDQEGITGTSLRVSTKSVKSTQKTRSSTRLHKEESEPGKEVDMSRDVYEESSATTEDTVNICESIITVKTNLESLDELANTNVEETRAVEPETSELLLGVEIDGKEEEPQTVEEVPLEEAELDDSVEKDDRTSVIQLQKATVVLVDLNKLSQNTEADSDTPEISTHSQTEENIEVEKPIYIKHQLCNLTPEEKEQQELQIEKDTKKTHERDKIEKENTDEEKNEPNKQDVAFEGQKLTKNLEEQIDVIETESIEGYSAVTSGENQEVTKLADKTNIIQETEQYQDVALLEKQADSAAVMSSIAHGAAESIKEIIEEDAHISTERSLRRRTIIVQSPPRKKSRRVQKQEAEAFEDKIGKLTVTGKVVEEINKEITKIDVTEEMSQNSTVETTDEEIPLAEEEPKECVAEKVAEEINQVENKVAYTNEQILETEEANLVQQANDPLVINKKQTNETEESLQMDPVVSKGQPYIVEGTTIQVEEEVECTDPNQSDHEGITKRRLRLSTKSVKTTQKTRSSTRLHKEESEPVKEIDMSRDVYEESSATTEETVNVCESIITVETNMESLDELANTNVEETRAVEPETSELLLGVEIDGKEEEPLTVEEVPLEEAELDDSVEKDDRTSVIQAQKATVVLVDLNKLSQNTEGENDTQEFPTCSQTEENMELDRPVHSGHRLDNLTAEEEENQVLQMENNIEMTPVLEEMQEEDTTEKQYKPNKRDETFEDQNLTEDLEEHIYVIEKKNLEADKSNLIQDGEKDQDVDLKEKQTESEAEMSSLLQESAVSVQEVLEDEAPVSIERQLRQRTIKVQSTPRKKSRGVGKQEASESKTGKVQINRKESAKVDSIEETIKQSTVEATEKISFIEAEPEKFVTEKVAQEINKIENKETNLVVAKDTDKEAPDMKRAANLEQQETYPLAINKKETVEKEKPMDINEDPEVNKEQTNILDETTIHLAEEQVSQVESMESNQSDHERIKRRSLRLGAKSVTLKQKNRKSTRLQNAELELAKEADMSRDEFEETSTTIGETSLQSFNKTVNMNVEETPAVEPETSELLIGVETYNEAPQTVKEVLLEDIEPDEGAKKEDDTPVIQLQKATVVLVDLNKHSQNTEGESDTSEVPTNSQTEENMELDNPVYSEHQLCNKRTEEEQQDLLKEEETVKVLEEDKLEEECTDEEHNELGKQDITSEGQKPTEDLERQIDVQRTIVEEVRHVHVQEAVTSGEHSEATIMIDKTNIQETVNDQNIALKDKHADSDVEISYLGTEAADAVQEALEEEAPVSTERSLRHRTIQIQSPLKRKSRRLQKQDAKAFEDKTTKIPITKKAVDEHQEATKIDDKEQTLQKSTVEATSEEIPPVETEPEECVAEKVRMVNKEINSGNEEALTMEREEAILEQQKNEDLVENIMETDEASIVTKEQTYILEETTVQAELELTKDISKNEDNSSITIESAQSKPAETNVKLLNVYGDMVSVSGNVETNSDEQGIDKSNDGGKVAESLHNISTDKEEVEIGGSIKTTENTVEETQKALDEGVQEKQKAGENTDQELEENIQDKTENKMISHQEQADSQRGIVWETNPVADFKATAVEAKVALEKTDQETSLITRRSLRSRTVTVQSTPRRTSKRHEMELERETKSDTCGNENNSALPQLADDLSIPVENMAEFEDTKEQENIIQLNTEDKAAEMEIKEDTVEEGKEIQEQIEQEKTHDDNLERKAVQLSKEQDEENQLKEIQYESAPCVQESSSDTEETRRTLRKRTIVAEAASRKSKQSRKKVYNEDIEHVMIIGQSESVEDNVELRSDESTVIFEVSNSGEEILQEILRNAEVNNKQIEKTDETLEEAIFEQCLEAKEQQLESSANEGFTLELEVEETSDLEENKVDVECRMSIEAPKVGSTSAEKSEGEENTSENDKKGLSIEKHVRQSSKAAVSARRKSVRLQILKSKKKTNESDSEESEVRYQGKRKAITDSTPIRRSKLLVDLWLLYFFKTVHCVRDQQMIYMMQRFLLHLICKLMQII